MSVTKWQASNVLAKSSSGSLIATVPKLAIDIPAPIARWDFDAATAPYPTITGDLPLQVLTGTPSRVTTPFGYGISFDGSSALYVPAASVGRLNVGAAGKNSVSIAAWVNSTDTNAGIVAGCWQESSSDPRRQYALFYDLPTYGGDDRVCMHVSHNGGATPGYPSSRDYAASLQTYSNSAWQFMLGTYDGARAIAYANGSAQSYQNYTDSLNNTYDKNPYLYPDGLNTVNADFTMGACLLTSGLNNFVIGKVARLRVWDVALTPQQVSTLYKREIPAY